MRIGSLLCAVVLLVGASGCFQKVEIDTKQGNEIQFSDIEIKYAEGFSINKTDSSLSIFIHDPVTGEALDTLDITGTSSEKSRYFSRIIAQSTTHFAFLEQIGSLQNLVGLCGKQYLNDDEVAQLKSTLEVCNSEGLDVEKVLATNPDLVFLYPFGDQDKHKLTKMGVNTIFLTEYLEKSPLARAEWLKLFALLSGKNPKESGFDDIEKQYAALVKKQLEKKITGVGLESECKSVAFNLPFGETWDMPSGTSISAKLAEDAGFEYLFKDEKQSGNLLFKLEDAYQILMKADYWIIIASRKGNYSLADLIVENRMYRNFPSVRSKQVFFCNTQTTSYFSQGPIEPHIILGDLVNCSEGNDSKCKYFKVLK